MGEFLIAPVVILIIAFGIWAFYFAGKTAQARRDEDTLPDDPYEREQERIRRLVADHEAARPENITHPARRP